MLHTGSVCIYFLKLSLSSLKVRGVRKKQYWYDAMGVHGADRKMLKLSSSLQRFAI